MLHGNGVWKGTALGKWRGKQMEVNLRTAARSLVGPITQPCQPWHCCKAASVPVVDVEDTLSPDVVGLYN